MRTPATILCIMLALASTTAAYAQPRGGGGARGAAPGPRAAAPQMPQRAASFPTAHGFQLNRDLTPPQAVAAPQRVAPPQRVVPPPQAAAPQRFAPPQQATAPQRRQTQPIARAPVAVRNNPPHQPPGNPGARRRISDPRVNGNPWSWNRGVAWNPAPAYWGGGFWGALGFAGAALAFGALNNGDQTYDSYEVYPDSPGADLLANYQLTQTPCGPPGLVQIWGPDNSLICAFPNNIVGPGDYDIDPSTLTLVSEAQ